MSEESEAAWEEDRLMQCAEREMEADERIIDDLRTRLAEAYQAGRREAFEEAAECVRLAGLECLQAGPASMNDLLLLSGRIAKLAREEQG